MCGCVETVVLAEEDRGSVCVAQCLTPFRSRQERTCIYEIKRDDHRER